MRTQHLRGSTEQLNRLSLPAGRVALNTDNGNVRFWDGETLGGYEVETQQAYEPPPPPGPTELIAGDLETGFYGEVDRADFISYADLSTLVGLSAGTLHNQTRSLWLKFSLDNHPCYVAKQSIRYGLSHDQLAGVDLVYGDRSVEIDGITYVIRLLTGLGEDSEWNRLLYPVHQSDPTGQGWEINYTNADLNVGTGNGRASWTQETNPNNTSQRISRGYSSVEVLYSITSSYTHVNYGWRPILVPVV